jgi:hypothetical protein
MRPATFRFLVTLTAALAAAGCGIFDRRGPERECPGAAIVGDASTIAKFRDGPGRDLSDVTFSGEVVDVDATCRYDRAGVNVDLRVLLSATRGPADRNRVVDLDYFVAIIDPQKNPLAKEQFRVRFEFRDQITRLNRLEELEPRIPLRDLNLGPDYQIVVGFQLTAEDLDFNRSRRSR